MTGSSSQQVQDELTHRCQPSPPPTLRAFLALFSANGLEGQLEALSQERGRRDIGRLGACYALGLERLGALEEAIPGGTRRESGRQAPLRARRPAVLLAEEAARLKRAGNAPRRVQ